VTAGIVGASRLSYDIWGDGVNLASRLQDNCEAGRINISEATVGLLGGAFELQARGELEAKNKGLVKMYYLLSQSAG
jgi:class 3 adenylate cyclase